MQSRLTSRVVLFDLFETVVSFPSYNVKKEIARNADIAASDTSWNWYFSGFPLAFIAEEMLLPYEVVRDCSLTNRYESISQFVSHLKRDYGGECSGEIIGKTEYITEELIKKSVLIDGVIFFLQELSKNYRIGLLSNISSFLTPIVKKHGLDKYFEIVLFSCDIGAKKPSLKIFEQAIRKFNIITSNQVSMIGDNYLSDIVPSKKLGFNTYWILTNVDESFIENINDELRNDFYRSYNDMYKFFAKIT